MNWLKKKYQENPAAFVSGGVAIVSTILFARVVQNNAKLQSKLAGHAKDVLQTGFDAFTEGYETAISEIEMIAENKEMQKALKQAASK